MGFKNKIENLILSRSNSYNFYKNHYYKYIHNKELDPSVEEEFRQIKEEFHNFQITTDHQMDTMNYLMKTLFIDYEINHPKNALKLIQQLSDEFLILINNICEKNNIAWWINYGNLLGAVRHGYFVPWDDEVDIGMMRQDYFEFEKIIKKEFDEMGLSEIVEVKYNTRNVNEKSINSNLQILVKNKTLINQGNDVALCVLNVFPYDFLDGKSKKAVRKQYKKSNKILLDNLLDENDFKSSFKQYSDDLGLSFNKSKYVICGPECVGFSDDTIIFDTDEIFPLNDISFGNNIFLAPNNVHMYLKRVYKDYLNLPRAISIPENTDNFRYIPNVEEIFDESIIQIREINSTF